VSPMTRPASQNQHGDIGVTSYGSLSPPHSLSTSTAPNVISSSKSRRSTATWIMMRPAAPRPHDVAALEDVVKEPIRLAHHRLHRWFFASGRNPGADMVNAK
jgi:hypothetical protein